MILFFWLIKLAMAAEYFLEVGPIGDKAAATAAQAQLKNAGIESRLVRQFRIGEGWEFLLIVEHIPEQAQADALATRIGTDTGRSVQIFRMDDGSEVEPEVEAPPKPTAAQLLEQTRQAHGGSSGGVSTLARAEAVHFVFDRVLIEGTRKTTYHHDYWREGANRRLVVDGPETDSLAIATASASWIKATGAQPSEGVVSRDIGVVINQVDAFAPEAVLAVALDAWHLLEASEVEGFRFLEGGEGGTRIGSGSTEEESGLSFLDIDASSSRIIRVRYITEGGPVIYSLSEYREVQPGLWVPHRVEIERGDGRRELILVKQLELLPAAPTGSFDKPV
jgi:hypothetical protein